MALNGSGLLNGQLGLEVTPVFADLPNQRCLTAPGEDLPSSELALRTNLMLVQGLLARARSVQMQLIGNCSGVVRQAKRKGLICIVTEGAKSGMACLSISGPFSLFRSTVLYGRALADLLPVVAWCNEFEIFAQIVMGDRLLDLKVRSGDPIFPSSPPKPFDGKLEERFCRGFRKQTKSWDIIREPEPISAFGTLIFPDFALVHRRDVERRWLLEIVGYWTPDYLRKKMEHLRDARISNLLLCVSDKLNCAEEEFPDGASVLRFNGQLRPADVLRIIGD